uniref:Uncharacterized protein n=1 Tax=Arundo donax TaxID=35708 RepID=A0A0A9FEP4_ARUDO
MILVIVIIKSCVTMLSELSPYLRTPISETSMFLTVKLSFSN